MSGQLTTHVLDLVLGHGAGGLKVWTRRIAPTGSFLGETELDSGGRGVLAAGDDFQPGLYELDFRVGDYHRHKGVIQGDAFLEEVPVRFRVTDPDSHCHVPLLVSLYGYSTYRGG